MLGRFEIKLQSKEALSKPGFKTSQTVLITGASSGIGASLASYYALTANILIISGRRRERLEILKKELIGINKQLKVFILHGDLNSPSTFDELKKIRESSGAIDTVIANAGFGVEGAFRDLELEDFELQFSTNVFSVIKLIKFCEKDLLETFGRLAIISSALGYFTIPGSIAYCMSKHAIRSLAEGLRVEYFGKISVTLIAPGIIESEFRLRDKHGKIFRQADTAPEFLVMPTYVAARKIKASVENRKRILTLTLHAKVLIILSSWFPFIFYRLNLFLRKKILLRHEISDS